MRTFVLVTTLLGCAFAASNAEAQVWAGRPGERSMPAAEALPAIRACASEAFRPQGDLSGEAVGALATGLLRPGSHPAGCTRHDPQAALALLEAYVGEPARRDSGALALWRLFELYVERSDARAVRRRHELRGLLWLRGLYEAPPDDPFLTRSEQQRLLADPRNLAFLRDWVALHPPEAGPRRRLAAALLIEGSPAYDPGAAAAAMPEDAPDNMRLRLLRALLAEERNYGAALEQLALLRLQPHALPGEDVLLIEAIVARASRLFEQAGEPHRTTGGRILAALAESDIWQARSALHSAIQSGGCCVVLEEFPPENRVRPLLVTDEDYPAAAVRAVIAGRVSLEAYFGPDGRLLFVDGGAGEPSILRRAAVRLWRRRSLLNVELQRHRGQYVRVVGPTLVFRLPSCVDGVAQPLPPPDPNVLTLTAQCMRRVIYQSH